MRLLNVIEMLANMYIFINNILVLVNLNLRTSSLTNVQTNTSLLLDLLLW